MRIWLPLAILLSVAWLLAVSVLASHGDDDAGPTTVPVGDAAALLRQSQAAMRGVDSLGAEMSWKWQGRELSYRVAWESPADFHILYPNITARYEAGKDPVIIDDGFVEAIAVGDHMYTRGCNKENEDCELWGEGIRDGTYVPMGASELDPFWTIELLGLVLNPQIVGQEDVDGVDCIRVRGEANLIRARVESWRHAEEIRGPLYWGDQCTSIDSATGATEECHSTTLDEYIAMQEDSAHVQGHSSGMVEVWIGREDKLMRKLGFPVLPGADPTFGFFVFSRFNQVTVEPPR